MIRREENEATTLALVTKVLALIAFYLYFGGWVYSNETLTAFGLAQSTIEIPVYFFIVYSYSVFFVTLAGWLLLLSLAGAWYAVAKLRFIAIAEVIIVIALTTIPFPLIRWLASSRARADVSYLRSGRAKPVKVYPKEAAKVAFPAELLDASEMGTLRLVIQTSDHYYVFVQPPGVPGQLPEAKLFSLSKEDVNIMVILGAVREAS